MQINYCGLVKLFELFATDGSQRLMKLPVTLFVPPGPPSFLTPLIIVSDSMFLVKIMIDFCRTLVQSAVPLLKEMKRPNFCIRNPLSEIQLQSLSLINSVH